MHIRGRAGIFGISLIVFVQRFPREIGKRGHLRDSPPSVALCAKLNLTVSF
jgi:hypothetical protein